MERQYEKLSPWVAPASMAILPSVYAAQARIRNIPINRGVLAAAVLTGAIAPQLWNSSVKEARSDKGVVSAFNKKTGALLSAHMSKHANWFTSGIKFISRAAADTGKVLVTKPSGLGDNVLRGIAIGGLGYGGYKGATALVGASKKPDYGTYERNLALHGKMSVDEMSASSFNKLLKTSALIKSAIGPTALLMAGMSAMEIASAGKKAKAPMLSPALKASQTVNSSAGMNNFK